MLSLTDRVVSWFKRNSRDLPWRKTSDPYKIWVSEVMLQQTTVATVIPYYKRFLKRFPTLESLAKASETEVLKYWQGLGYYRRAKNLRLGAQYVVENFSGKIPETRDELLQIPGIGKYSAGAILSIAFRIPTPALDGNLIRVYSRFEGIRRPVDDPSVLKKLWEIALKYVPSTGEASRDFAEGMMELGALICLPRNPRCDACPLKQDCSARKNGWTQQIPRKEFKLKRRRLVEIVFWDERKGKLALLPRGADPKFPDFRRLPFEIASIPPARDSYQAKFKYAVTDRDFEVYLRRAKLRLREVVWVNREEVEKSLLPAIDWKIIKSQWGS